MRSKFTTPVQCKLITPVFSFEIQKVNDSNYSALVSVGDPILALL